MIDRYTALVTLHEHERRAPDHALGHDTKAPGQPPGEDRFATAKLTVEADDIACLKTTPKVFSQCFRLNVAR
jgi:hypothetical protein